MDDNQVIWATLDALNSENKRRYQTPQHHDYLLICRSVEKARSHLIFLREEFQDGFGSISEVEKANEWFLLSLDAERYMWALHYGSNCTCNPAGKDICRFCTLENRYKEWKKLSKGS